MDKIFTVIEFIYTYTPNVETLEKIDVYIERHLTLPLDETFRWMKQNSVNPNEAIQQKIATNFNHHDSDIIERVAMDSWIESNNTNINNNNNDDNQGICSAFYSAFADLPTGGKVLVGGTLIITGLAFAQPVGVFAVYVLASYL